MKAPFGMKSKKLLSSVVAVCFLGLQATCFLPANARASAGDDLKKIEYRYYFRGDYRKAIAEFHAFLKRRDLSAREVVEAREYLAASLILSGAAEKAKSQYLAILKMNNAYDGPDPSVFKPIVIATFDEAKDQFASMTIRTVPDMKKSGGTTPTTTPVGTSGKPIYKKWWFYAVVGVALLAVAGAAGSGGGDSGAARDTGTVTIEVGIQ